MGGHGVHGLVCRRHRVEKGLEAALEEVHERLLGRKSLRATQHRVLKNVRHTGVVFWKRSEVCREALVQVGGVDQHDLGTGRLVVIHADGDATLSNLLRALQNKPISVGRGVELLEALWRRGHLQG